MDTLYDILEVSRKASKEVIDKAYKTLAKKYHPDLQTSENREYAEEMMKKINDAYDILSNEEKRNEYDRKLEEQEEQAIHYENMNYSNQNQNNIYRQQTVENESKSDEFDWRSQFANLSPKEKKRLIKKIEKEANEEYRKQYEDYFRSLGFRIKHRWTFKDFLIIGLVILALAFIFLILWLIPPTHEWLLKLYNDNFVVNLFVRIIWGICQGAMKFFQNLTKY
ncbi:MAG: DnaJ domain-containing protein [Clostridia bacterium]